MSRFKRGPAKTRDGKHVYIVGIGERIYARNYSKLNQDFVSEWALDGSWSPRFGKMGCDIMPNDEPHREEFEADLITVGLAHPKEKWVTGLILPENTKLQCGVRVRVTVEAVE